jgi:hypothetical protein
VSESNSCGSPNASDDRHVISDLDFFNRPYKRCKRTVARSLAMQEFHLFHVLSEPPVPVARRRLHRWSSGDVVATTKNSALASERFVVLDGDADGRMLALRVAQLAHKVGQASDNYLWVRQDGEEWESVGSPTESITLLLYWKC